MPGGRRWRAPSPPSTWKLALFRDAAPGGRAVDALRELVAGGALPLHDPLTAKMLEAFGWKPLGELVDDAARRGPAEPTT